MRRWIWLALGGLLLALVGCGQEGPLQIRIRNDSGQQIENFWLGAGGMGGPSTAYGAIAPGETSAYKSFSLETANYSKCNFITADGRQYIVNSSTRERAGLDPLAAGRYTFAYSLVDDQGLLTIVAEE